MVDIVVFLLAPETNTFLRVSQDVLLQLKCQLISDFLQTTDTHLVSRVIAGLIRVCMSLVVVGATWDLRLGLRNAF